MGSNAGILNRGLRFVQSAQAFGTQIHAFGPTLHHDSHPLDIGLPLPLSAVLRLGDVVPKLWLLAAKITFGHLSPHWQIMRSEIKTSKADEISLEIC